MIIIYQKSTAFSSGKNNIESYSNRMNTNWLDTIILKQ